MPERPVSDVVHNPYSERDLERFWPRIDRSGGPDACWPWTAKSRGSNGYGRFTMGARMQQVHRVAYEILVGPIAEGLHVDHKCHNADPTCPGSFECEHRRCCNPAHLEPITNRANLLRSGITVAAQHAAQTHCKWGHEFNATNTKIVNAARGWRACRRCAADQARAKRIATGLGVGHRWKYAS